MKTILQGTLAMMLMLLSVSCRSGETEFKTGIEVLKKSNFACLQGNG